jgi:hypothetical protein
MFDCPSLDPVSFDAFHLQPIVKPSPVKDALPISDEMGNQQRQMKWTA